MKIWKICEKNFVHVGALCALGLSQVLDLDREKFEFFEKKLDRKIPTVFGTIVSYFERKFSLQFWAKRWFSNYMLNILITHTLQYFDRTAKTE